MCLIMDEQDWLLLRTLYYEGTITKAAQKMYISQPALTYRIKQIEKKFSTKIVIRGKKGVIFTEEGEYLLKYAEKMIRELRNTKDILRNMQGNIQGVLRLGVSSNYAFYKLPKLLEGFLNKYPNVEVKLTTGWSSNILNLIQSEDIHIAIVRGEHNWPGKNLVLAEEPLYIASKEKVSLEDLPKLNFIQYETDFSLKNTFDHWWQSTFTTPPKIGMIVDRIETCKELVKRGLGYTMLPSISDRKSTR